MFCPEQHFISLKIITKVTHCWCFWQDFLLQACETASLSLSSNLKGKNDKQHLGNTSKLIAKENNVSSILCGKGLRSPLSSLRDNAVAERVASDVSNVSSNGNNSLGAGCKSLTVHGQSLNSKPNGLSHLPITRTFSSNKCCLSPPSKRLAIEANLSPPSNSVGGSLVNMFQREKLGLGSSTRDPGNEQIETENILLGQRSCNLQINKHNSVKNSQGNRQHFTGSQEKTHTSSHKSPVISRDIDCDFRYGSKFSGNNFENKKITLKENSKDGLQNHCYKGKQPGNCKNSVELEISTGQRAKPTVQPRSSSSGLGLNDNSLVIQTPNKLKMHDHSVDYTPLKMPQGTPRARRFPGPAGLLPKLVSD